MVARAIISLSRLALLVAIVVSVTATGFGHRMPTPEAQALIAALANGATLADFCGGDVDGDGHPDASCLACQITASADLPPVLSTVIDLELAFQAQVIAPREARALGRVLDPAHSPQGPPVA